MPFASTLKTPKATADLPDAPDQAGEVAAFLAGTDLPGSPLGPPAQWPAMLATLARTALASRMPMLIGWGPQLACIYNDAYIPFLGDKHPAALGRPYLEVWKELGAELEPMVSRGWEGQATAIENERFLVRRNGYAEPIWASFSHSPLFEDGTVVGALVVGAETTRQVQSMRAQELQMELAERTRGLADPVEIVQAACELLGREIGADHSYFTEIDEAGDSYQTLTAWAAEAAVPPRGERRLSDFGAATLDVLRAGQALAVGDTQSDPRTAPFAQAYAESGVRALLSVPLHRSGTLVACLTLTRLERARWSEHDIALTEDVTQRVWNAVERARAEQALQAERDRSGQILENLDEGFILLDRQFRVRQINAAALRMEQRPAEEILGRLYWDAWPGSEEAPLGRLYKRSMSMRIPMRLEHRHAGPDGHSAWTEVHGYPHADGLAVFFRDITERKEAEQALMETAQRLQFALDSARIGDWDWDLRSGQGQRSLRHDQCFGYSEPIVGWTYRRFLDCLHPEDRPWVEEKFRSVLSQSGDLHLECRVVWPDESVHWLAVHGNVYASDGVPERMSGIVYDITESKLLEQERREAIRHLQLAVDIAHLGSWEWNVATGDCYFSPLWKQQLGYSPVELEDRLEEWKSRLHPEDAPWVLDDLAEFAAHHSENYRVEYRLRHRDGSYRWMMANAVAVEGRGPGRLALAGTQLDITETKLAEQRVLAAAQHDPLTGLPNRALVFEYAGRILAAARRSHTQGAFLFIDLDRFKPINDLYGHHVGDLLLKAVAARLEACVRQEDLVARLGGDEFLIVLQHTGTAHPAATVAQHVLEALSTPFEVDSLSLSVSASIGISQFPLHGTDVDTLVHAADLAMYHSKHEGRGNYYTFTPELIDRADASSAIEARLKRALLDGGLTLHYQPVIDMKSRQPIGAEALLRLVGDDGAFISPDQFIMVAESAGLIAQVGEWVVREACRQQNQWEEEGLPPVAVAINVSPLQFRQRGFAEQLQAIVQEAGVDPSLIQIEVTESTVMDSVDDAVQTLSGIRDAGIRIALDDFGTGYSSLSHLSHLPLDKLKVDQSFVRRLEHDKASRAITEAIIALGRTLNLEVVGEGIESAQALSYLQEHGCNQAQGFFISRPLPAEEFSRWYRERSGNTLH